MAVQVNKSAVNLEEGIQNLFAGMVEDYAAQFPESSERIQEFKDSLTVDPKGQKYTRLVRGAGTLGSTVVAFIVKKETKGFPVGTVLKASGWKTPAMNASRGNVLTGGYPINWTGPLYL